MDGQRSMAGGSGLKSARGRSQGVLSDEMNSLKNPNAYSSGGAILYVGARWVTRRVWLLAPPLFGCAARPTHGRRTAPAPLPGLQTDTESNPQPFLGGWARKAVTAQTVCKRLRAQHSAQAGTFRRRGGGTPPPRGLRALSAACAGGCAGASACGGRRRGRGSGGRRRRRPARRRAGCTAGGPSSRRRCRRRTWGEGRGRGRGKRLP